jgi:aminoglycoside phosphotransferase family enzyme
METIPNSISFFSVPESFSGESFSQMVPETPHDRATKIHSYIINEKHQSVCACIFFAQRVDTNEDVVIKILRPSSDVRYKKLETISKRQQCQIEAIHWNKRFTHNVYIGLGRVYSSSFDELHNGEVIRLGEVSGESKLLRDGLDPNSDYALLMYQLPSDRRLDILLKVENEDARLLFGNCVVDRVIELHNSLPTSTEFNEDGDLWGSVKQLEKKLAHNLELLDSAFPTSKNSAEGYDAWQKNKDILRRLLTEGRLPGYFRQRVQERCIKRCHGDLKAPNIWIMPGDQLYDDRTTGDVLILDAIDFNPLYCNIDGLSDIALLITDVHARTNSRSLADQMTKYYLQKTTQDNEVCNAILRYYLVEKAIFSAAIIYFDENPDLDLASSFWEIADMRMEDVKRESQLL